MILQNPTWVSGDNDRPGVSHLILQPIVQYNLPDEWCVTVWRGPREAKARLDSQEPGPGLQTTSMRRPAPSTRSRHSSSNVMSP